MTENSRWDKKMEEQKKTHRKVPFWHFCSIPNLISPSLKRIFGVFAPILGRREGDESRSALGFSLFLGFASVVVGCLVNLTIPIYNKKIGKGNCSILIVDSLKQALTFPDTDTDLWSIATCYVILKMVQGIGTVSLIHCVQSYSWIKIREFLEKRVQTEFFRHVLHLRVKWHADKKTSDVLGALETGTDSILSVVEHLFFSIIPTGVDILVAIIYLSLHFGRGLGSLILLQVTFYLTLTIYLTETTVIIQKPFLSAINDMRNVALESLYNFQTVKYFTREEYETRRFSRKISGVHKTQRKVSLSIIWMQLLQVTVLYSGFFVGLAQVIWAIQSRMRLGSENEAGETGETSNNGDDDFSVGDYVLLTSYLAQLYGPLNYLGTYYRDLRTNLQDLEWMLQIFDAEPEESSERSSRVPSTKFKLESGRIEFKNVSFGYEDDGDLILKNVSFVVPPKKVVALVGASGSGKSSILKLLLRFYDAHAGEILIDEKPIEKISPKVLRDIIGVVPQDSTLFNDTLKENVKYAKLDASERELYEATTKACLHHKIISLPKAYETPVGERGIKVSGGEKQRLGISRIFLKNPPFILLDEVTSSLDIQTEREIVGSLKDLCRSKTCLVITHRLCTIQDAHEILVLRDGSIVERGKHEELLYLQGEYANMWKEEVKKAQHLN